MSNTILINDVSINGNEELTTASDLSATLQENTVNALGVDTSSRTIWINGQPYGNAYVNIKDDNIIEAPIGAEIFNDFANNVSSGEYSHAEGKSTSAPGKKSHAEGGGTTANGECSHAEGGGTTASGYGSHAEGTSTNASGTGSHAEGQDTFARGFVSHAEGAETNASGSYSHAECNGTTASGESSHAEGLATTAAGVSSHAEGSDTTAEGVSSHAEGYNTTAEGMHSHAEGTTTVAKGDSSHAEGAGTKALEHCSHAEGQGTTATGDYSHAEGEYTITNNIGEHAEGRYNKSNEQTIHSVGIGTSDDDRKNAHEIMQDGRHYIYNIGGYNGTNPSSSNDIATILSTVDTSDTTSFNVENILNVTGATTLKGNVTLGDAEADTITVKGDTTFNKDVDIDKTLNVDGNTTLKGNLDVDSSTTLNSDVTLGSTEEDTITVNGTTNFKTDVDIDTKLNVDGNTTLKGNLDVDSSTTLGSDVTLGGTEEDTITVNGTTNFKTDVDIDTNLNVDGNITIGGTLNVTGATTLNGNVTLGDAEADTITVKGDTTFNKDVDIDKTLNVDGNTTLKGNLDVDSSTTLSSDVTLGSTEEDTITVNGTTNFKTDVDIDTNLNVDGNTTLKGNVTLGDAISDVINMNGTVAGNIKSNVNDGGLIFNEQTNDDYKVYIQMGGSSVVKYTKNPTDTAEKVSLGTSNFNTAIKGTAITLQGPTTINNNLTVAEGKTTSLGGDLEVSGATFLNSAVTCDDNLDVHGATTLGALTVNADQLTTLGGDLVVNGDVTFNSGTPKKNENGTDYEYKITSNIPFYSTKNVFVNGALVSTGENAVLISERFFRSSGAALLIGPNIFHGENNMYGSLIFDKDNSATNHNKWRLVYDNADEDFRVQLRESKSTEPDEVWDDAVTIGHIVGENNIMVGLHGNTVVGGNLTISPNKSTALGGILTVSGETTLNDKLSITKNGLAVVGDSQFSGNVGIGSTNTNQNLTVYGATTIKGNLTASTIKSTGNIFTYINGDSSATDGDTTSGLYMSNRSINSHVDGSYQRSLISFSGNLNTSASQVNYLTDVKLGLYCRLTIGSEKYPSLVKGETGTDNWGLDCNNSDIVRVNSIAFNDTANNATEGILFKHGNKDDDAYSSIWVSGAYNSSVPKFSKNVQRLVHQDDRNITDYDIYYSGASLIPFSTNAYDIGSSLYRFKNLYLSGDSAVFGNSTVGGNLTVSVNTTSASLNITSGNITSSVNDGGLLFNGQTNGEYNTVYIQMGGSSVVKYANSAVQLGTSNYNTTIKGDAFILLDCSTTVDGSLIVASGYATTLGGNLTVNGNALATAFYESSDATKKDVVSNLNVDFDKLKQIPKVNFTWKNDESKQNNIGTIAQELNKVYPELVNGEEGNMTVDYAKLSIIALAAIDKLEDRIKQLEDKLQQYEK